jgi:hypothetical protein
LSSKEIRVAVGETSGKRSTVWKIWTQKSDVYIQSRMMGSDSKVSLHASGQCQWSDTSEWVSRQSEAKNSDRHIVKWNLPEILPGQTTHVFRIVIPHSELRQINIDEKLNKIVWLPEPNQGYATQIECYITPQLDGPPDTSNSPYQYLATLALSDRRWFVLFVQESLITEQFLEGTRTQIISNAKKKGITFLPQNRLSVFIEYPDGCKGLMEMVPTV